MMRMIRRLRRDLKRAGRTLGGKLAVGGLNLVRMADTDRAANVAGWVMRRIGPLMPEQRVGRANLAAAFPEKSAQEIDAILDGVWDNLGRVGIEFAHLDRLWNYDANLLKQDGRIVLTREGVERFEKLKFDGKPALVFAAHLANWELPAVSAATYGLESAVLYRGPNNAEVSRWLRDTRAANMGELIPTGLEAPVKITRALERGAHVGMLVDQFYDRGVEVEFFGRHTRTNPLIARLARHFDCPIHGTRMIRLPGNRFRGEITEEIAPARDAEGKIDILGTMQIITAVVEGWIREHPEQWLWLHRRWRPDAVRPFKGRSSP